MEREANYVAVGTFVLLVIAMAGLFVYWYSDSRERRDYVRYEIYFEGSVSGLAEGGPVRYLGVDVGRVVRILLDQRAADRVRVIVDVDAVTPVSNRTLAQLSLQGVTGLLYIDLLQQRDTTPATRVLADVPSERYPVIRSMKSDLDLFVSSLPDLAARVGELAVRASALLSDDNIAAFSRTLNEMGRAAGSLPGTLNSIGTLVDELRATAQDAHRTITDIASATHGAAPDFAAAVKRLRESTDHLASASSQLDSFLAQNRSQLSGFLSDDLPQIDALLRESRQTVQQFGDFSRSLKDNPSRILYQPPVNGLHIPP